MLKQMGDMKQMGNMKQMGSTVVLAVAAAVMNCLLWTGPAGAVDLSSGEIEARLDTTLSYGVTFRVEERDKELTDRVNDNDGDLNYDRGIVSNAFKFTSELDAGYRNVGLFVRASGLYDIENEHGTRSYRDLSGPAKSLIGKDIDLLDAYVTGTFDVGDAAVDVRLGKHVLNWGESTFIQNGISAVNPFDVSKLRVPGAELREALLAVPLVSASVAPTASLSMEGFYQLDWEKTELDPVGSYFSVTDYVGPGADRAIIDLPGLDLGDRGLTAAKNPFVIFSGLSDPRAAAAFSSVTADDPDFLMANRTADRKPGDSGQWGIAFRYLFEEWSDIEVGFYFMNYHSRLPVVSAHTGTATDAGKGLAAAGAISAAAPTAVGEVVTAAVTRALTAARCPSATHSAECGALANKVRTETTALAQGAAAGAAQAAGIDAYAEKGHYFIEYPEDIQLYGVSFNTAIGTTGWALQGEYSWRRDAPLQLAERKLFAEALRPFTGLTACIGRQVANGVSQQMAGPRCIAENAAAGRYDADTVGYVLRDVSQVQATATKVFGPVLGSDGGAFVTEVAVMHVHDLPDGKDVAADALTPADMPLESPAGAVGSDDNDADATSWGYRLAARLDYNGAVGAVNLFPYLRFGHDVGGNSPAPSGSFVEGRTALTFGLGADYLSRWQADLGYTLFAGRRNKLRDRDFITATVRYSF